MQYNLKSEYAKEGDSAGGARIMETGSYIGKFTMAKAVIASTMSTGIEFDFEAEDGKTAKYLTIYTHNKDGNEIWGLKQVNAIMACAGVKTMNGQMVNAKVYDHDARKEVDAQVEAYPEIINVPIGLVLQKELYTSNAGEDKERMTIYTPFEAATKRTATERLDSLDATAIDQILNHLSDKNSRKSTAAPAAPTASAATTASPDINFDDDIPFQRSPQTKTI